MRLLRSTVLAFAVLAGLLPPAGADAPAGSVAAGPRIQAVGAAAGATAAFPIEVRSFNESVPLPVRFELGDLDARGWLAPAQTTPYTLVGHATLPEPLTLGPGESRRLAVMVRSDGRTRYGAVVVVAGPAATPFVRIALKLVLTAPGAGAEPEAHLTLVSTGMATLDLRNTGDGLLSGRGVLFLLSPDGRFLGRMDIPPLTALPHGGASFTLHWPEPLPAGTVGRAVLTLDGRAQPFVANAAVP